MWVEPKPRTRWMKKPGDGPVTWPQRVEVLKSEVNGMEDYVTFCSPEGEERKATQGIFLLVYEPLIRTRYERLVNGGLAL